MRGHRESSDRRRHRKGRHRSRRGMVAVVVLLLIAMALAASYAAMRSQMVTLNVRQNASLGVSAQRAALTGLTAGFREMHSPNWSGMGTTFSRALGSHEGFQVQFLAGDETLVETDPDYSELPYRVTLLVTGTATDPADSRRVSRHTIRAVARLILRALPGEPSKWSSMQDYTFYQTKELTTTLDIPCRIEGNIRLQGKLGLGEHYPNDLDAWANYFYHLNQMRWNGYNDHRTLTGRVDYNDLTQDWYVKEILMNYMSVTTLHRAPDLANADWVKPTCLTSYRLFPGGREYAIPSVSGTLQNRTLAASATDNPLGLYYAGSDLTLGDNVTVRGTLFCCQRLRIDGENVRLESVDVPPLYGSSLPIRLPVATCSNLEVRCESSCTVKGLLAVFGGMQVAQAASRGQLAVAGRIIADDLDINPDTDWASVNWYQQFNAYLAVLGPSWVYFPVWMQWKGYPYAPTVHIKPGDDVRYHWYRPGETVFVPHVDDFSEMDSSRTPGLRWELIEIAQTAD